MMQEEEINVDALKMTRDSQFSEEKFCGDKDFKFSLSEEDYGNQIRGDVHHSQIKKNYIRSHDSSDDDFTDSDDNKKLILDGVKTVNNFGDTMRQRKQEILNNTEQLEQMKQIVLVDQLEQMGDMAHDNHNVITKQPGSTYQKPHLNLGAQSFKSNTSTPCVAEIQHAKQKQAHLHLLMHIHSIVLYNPLTAEETTHTNKDTKGFPNEIMKGTSKSSKSRASKEMDSCKDSNHDSISDSIQLYIDIRYPFTYSPMYRRVSVTCVENEINYVHIFHDLGTMDDDSNSSSNNSMFQNGIETKMAFKNAATDNGSSDNVGTMNEDTISKEDTWKMYSKSRNRKACSIALRYDKQIRMGVHTLFDLDELNASTDFNDDNFKSGKWNCKESNILFASRWINKVAELRIRIYRKYPLYFSLRLPEELKHVTSVQYVVVNNYDERNLKRSNGKKLSFENGKSKTIPFANSFIININQVTLDDNSSNRTRRIKQIVIQIQDLLLLCAKEFQLRKMNENSQLEYVLQIQDHEVRKILSLQMSNSIKISGFELEFQVPQAIQNPIKYHPLFQEISDKSVDYNAYTFAYPSIIPRNRVEILLDGLQTFSRYYHYMMQAKKSINIVGWELSLTFGLVYVPSHEDPREVKTKILHFEKLKRFLRKHNLWPKDAPRRWITLQDVLLAKAAQGVKVKIIVWRHNFISMLNRYLYMGEVTIEREVEKLKKKAATMNIRVVPLHYSTPLTDESEFCDPFAEHNADILVLIVGNPKGIVSCCHEKLVLVDAELPRRCVAFTGGFDIARGRFDQPKHLPPRPLFDWHSFLYDDKEVRYSGKEIQPFFRHIRMLWHDSQVMIQGPATRTLYLHFAQRWTQAFHTTDLNAARTLSLPPSKQLGEPFEDPIPTDVHPFFTQTAPVRIFRQWPTVLQTHVLLDHFCSLINRSKEYIYIEHQYPFHSFALAHCMCEALKRNPKLKVIVVAPIKNDLPNGIIGALLDISSDHIIEHLDMIYRAAPDRFAAYGIVRQEPSTKSLRAVYVHSKLILVDDEIISIGSSNLDYLSFSQSSEIQLEIYNRKLCIDTKLRLLEEHLEQDFDGEVMRDNFDIVFEVFKQSAINNYQSFKSSGIVHGRPFSIAPQNNYLFALSHIHVPSIIGKTLFKFGITPTFIKRYIPITSLPCYRRRQFLQSRL